MNAWQPSILASAMLAALLVGAGCDKPRAVAAPPAPADAPWFEDVTVRSGIDFVHDAGPLGTYRLPEIMGSGAALFDYDNDGRLDVYLVQNGGPQGPRNKLFHQEPDGVFRDASAGSGLDVAGYGMGVAIGDFNNDGLPDILLCEYGGVRLFLNLGHGAFREVTREAGLPAVESASRIRPWPVAAVFADLHRSGWLDLVVVSYVAFDPTRVCTDAAGKQDYCGPADFSGTVTHIYRNLGVAPFPNGSASSPAVPRFEDVTARAGLSKSPAPSLGVVVADLDGDGWPDLLVANDGRPNQLWINQHDGTFKDEAEARGIAFNIAGATQANMGIALGSVTGGELQDVYITHLTQQNNTLWRQAPAGVFSDRTAEAGLTGHGQGTGFGTVLADFDLDGALDLAVVNGHVLRAGVPASSAGAGDLVPYWRDYAQCNQLFAGDGKAHFQDISATNRAFCESPNVGRGLACGDIFNDGSVSLLATTAGGPARLFRNIAPRHGHWILIRAIDPRLGGRDAYGAWVTVHTVGRQYHGWVNPGSSYLCSNDPRVHLGLGQARRMDSIEVCWPDGSHESFPGGPSDAFRLLRHGDGSPASSSK